jgi:hypothetical protein
MKATINRLVYDTETAEFVASASHGCRSDFNYWAEALYKTKRGNYFLHGEGGAMSRYAESLGNNSRCGGSAIVPMTEAEAIAWCEEHGRQAAIDEYFQHLVEEA